jgi:cytoskeletal protein RodZ
MRPAGPGYSPEKERRGRRRAGRQRLVVVATLLVVVILVIGLAVGFSGRGGGTSSTTTGSETTSSEAAGSTTTSPGEATSTSATDTETFSAELSGQDEVPPVTTLATGTLTLTVSADASSVAYLLKAGNIQNLTVARLHEGATGKNGSTIATLYAGPTKSGTFTGTVAQGSLTKADLVGPLKGKTINDLVALLRTGSVYVNVGTTGHKSGEIRGQLQ